MPRSLAPTALLACLLSSTLALPVAAAEPAASAPSPTVRVALETSKGRIVLELDRAKAPKSVESFLAYVRSGHYDGTIFHRVIPGFMIQTGGYTPDLTVKPTKAPVKNEASNGLKNLRGTVAMARRDHPDSATSQFFVNLVDNPHLDPNADSAGYTVFGKVVEGMEVVDAIAAAKTGVTRGLPNVPVETITLRKATALP